MCKNHKEQIHFSEKSKIITVYQVIINYLQLYSVN